MVDISTKHMNLLLTRSDRIFETEESDFIESSADQLGSGWAARSRLGWDGGLGDSRRISEETLEPTLRFQKLVSNIGERMALIIDPMLATSVATIDLLSEQQHQSSGAGAQLKRTRTSKTCCIN